ncbi:MAG: GYD domain-containing protein [Desulfobacca sp.]|uniref:GYD domain-containing protein n=1 Tax=Desulfobacca sp. TaxID=2067990 RepID=UPI00404B6E3B
MATFILFGKYSAAALQGMSPGRTQQIVDVIKKFGGEVQGMYATLGDQDLVFILNLPGIEQAMQVSVALNKMTSIGFTTAPAVTAAEFDQIMAGV